MIYSNKNVKSAFTLLEIIVALAIMDMVALSLYSSLYTTVNARRSARDAIRPKQELSPVFDSIRRDIQSAMRPTGILAGGFYGEDISDGQGNDADVVQFCCASYWPGEDEKASNIMQTAYEIVLDSETQENVLVRQTTVNLLSSKTTEATLQEVVGRRINSLNFRYFDGYDWYDSWDSTTMDDQLPIAVEIIVTTELQNENKNNETDAHEQLMVKRMFMLPCAQPITAI